MQRIKLEISYDGTRYSGWQIQHGVPTIQDELQKVLRKITDETVSVTGSGRTDAGVHALKQVAAFSTSSSMEPSVFFRALNGLLPQDIRISRAEKVPMSFHPIADAVSKRYRYLIDDGRPCSPITRNYCWIYREPLDLEAMQTAACHLLGEHDFSCFETQGSPRKSPVRTITDVSVQRVEENLLPPLLCIEVEANGFLYNMMRAISGTLALIGAEVKRRRQTPQRIKEIIESRNRALAGPTAPPQGLYLVDVQYPNTCSGDYDGVPSTSPAL